MKRLLFGLAVAAILCLPSLNASAVVAQQQDSVEKACMKRAVAYCNQPPFNQDTATQQACVTAYVGICVDANTPKPVESQSN